jgi:hypothetical protein
MASMIERLIGDPVLRLDDLRILPVRRPLPERPRDLLEVFAAMGGEASLEGLFRSLDLRGGTPGWITFVALNRWPTLGELPADPASYKPARHLTGLLNSLEFRRLLAQRVFSTYPEKQRLLFVRVPRCAGEHFLSMMQRMHPIFPNAVMGHRKVPPPDFYRTLGLFLGRFNHARTIMLVQPRLTPFYLTPDYQAGMAPFDPQAHATDPLPWTMSIPPYRTGDRLFTIVRDPEDIILSRVNAIARALQGADAGDAPAIKRWRQRVGKLPDRADTAAWASVARSVLARFTDPDPICHALGDGTMQGALDACAITNIEIADMSRYDEWILRTCDTKPEPREPVAEPMLPKQALIEEDRERLAMLTTQDRPLYAKIRAALSASEPASIKGGQLSA